MKAVRVHELGGPDVLRYEETTDPKPSKGEALVKIAAAGVNFLDIYYRSGFHWGGHHSRPLPYIPGAEAAGTVVAVNNEVTGINVGDRVAYGISNGYGSYAELYNVPSWHLFPLPSAVDFATAAAVMLQGMTAHYLTHSTFPLEEGQTALVHAAAGGVGLLLVQLAKMRGANVIGTTGTEEKAQLAKEAGADEVILYTEQDFVEETERITDGEGVHVVYDSVGQATFDGGLDVLRPRGYMVLFGASSGPVEPLDPQVLNQKGGLFLTRPSLAQYTLTREELLWRAENILSWIGQNNLDVRIGGTYELSDVAQAHQDLEGRKTTGKLLLIP
jgi:NADPH2:quinone reductase